MGSVPALAATLLLLLVADASAQWSAPESLGGGSQQPRVAVAASGDAASFLPGPNDTIVVRRRSGHSGTWSAPQVAVATPDDVGGSTAGGPRVYPLLAKFDPAGRIHIVFSSRKGDSAYALRESVAAKGSDTFTLPRQLAGTSYPLGPPGMTFAGEEELVTLYSGLSSAPASGSGDFVPVTDAPAGAALLAAGGAPTGAAVLAWTNPYDYTVSAKLRPAGGSFGAAQTLGGVQAGHNPPRPRPVMTASGRIAVSWTDSAEDKPGSLKVALAEPGGAFAATTEVLTNDGGPFLLTAPANELRALGLDVSGRFITRRAPAGQAFGPPVLGDAVPASIALMVPAGPGEDVVLITSPTRSQLQSSVLHPDGTVAILGDVPIAVSANYEVFGDDTGPTVVALTGQLGDNASYQVSRFDGPLTGTPAATPTPSPTPSRTPTPFGTVGPPVSRPSSPKSLTVKAKSSRSGKRRKVSITGAVILATGTAKRVCTDQPVTATLTRSKRRVARKRGKVGPDCTYRLTITLPARLAKRKLTVAVVTTATNNLEATRGRTTVRVAS